MDPRSQRTRAALHAAILDLASREPVRGVSVVAVCRSADVTRDTFYRYSSDPAQLLADALGEELARLGPALHADADIGDAERRLLAHVHHRAAAYRGALDPVLVAPVRRTLEATVRAGLEQWVQNRPEILPPPLREDPAALPIAIAYAAGGTVSAIEEWLRGGAGDVDAAVRRVLLASPEWWQR